MTRRNLSLNVASGLLSLIVLALRINRLNGDWERFDPGLRPDQPSW